MVMRRVHMRRTRVRGMCVPVSMVVVIVGMALGHGRTQNSAMI
jgi:hypothetical protein